MLSVLSPSDEHIALGLISGTSADGVDAALVRLRDRGAGARLAIEHDLLVFRTVPYPPGVRERVLAAADLTARDLIELDISIGRCFGEAAVEVVAAGGIRSSQLALVGSHGQTICHIPPSNGRLGGTMQLGQASIIAEMCGAPVVSDFRARDMALGGQGAPLVPWVDHLLFAVKGERRVLLNIGGIANITAVDGDPGAVRGFDTGPGNALMDALVRLHSHGDELFDRDGARAARGRIQAGLLADLLAHPYLAQSTVAAAQTAKNGSGSGPTSANASSDRTPVGPKSVDRDTFGAPLARRLLAEYPSVAIDDLVATAARFTAESIADAILGLAPPFEEVDRVIASGGGVNNLALMGHLRERLDPIPLERTDAYGVPSEAKEAIAFAVLGRETLLMRHGNVPAVTGAARAVVLGCITP